MRRAKEDHTHVHLSKRHLVALTFDGWRPRLQLHEKHEKATKWILRSITGTGVLVNFFSLPWFLSVPIAVLLLAIEQFIERSVFVYTSFYIHPVGFEVEAGKWESMAYIFPERAPEGIDVDLNDANAVGLVFNDADYGVRFFEFLKSWNYGDGEDKDNNIRLSFITDENRYFVFLYPSQRRKSARSFFSKVRKSMKRTAPRKQPVEIEMSQVFFKSFDTMAAGYQLGTFVKKQTRKKKVFYLLPVHSAGGGKMGIAHRDHWIKKWHYVSKNRHELKHGEYEYLLWQRLDL